MISGKKLKIWILDLEFRDIDNFPFQMKSEHGKKTESNVSIETLLLLFHRNSRQINNEYFSCEMDIE